MDNGDRNVEWEREFAATGRQPASANGKETERTDFELTGGIRNPCTYSVSSGTTTLVWRPLPRSEVDESRGGSRWAVYLRVFPGTKTDAQPSGKRVSTLVVQRIEHAWISPSGCRFVDTTRKCRAVRVRWRSELTPIEPIQFTHESRVSERFWDLSSSKWILRRFRGVILVRELQGSSQDTLAARVLIEPWGLWETDRGTCSLPRSA